jgi:uncharacterized protein
MKAILLDIGPIIALLDRADAKHVYVVKRLGQRKGALVTSAAVVTEVMFHLQDINNGVSSFTEFLSSLNVQIEDTFDPVSLKASAMLMTKYADLPMDFADATLTIVASRLNTPDILTLDERGFRNFRFSGNKPFHLLLQDGSR